MKLFGFTNMTRQKSKLKDALSPFIHRAKDRAIKWQKQHTKGMEAEQNTNLKPVL